MSLERAYREVADIIYANDNDVDIIAEMTNVADAETVMKNVYKVTGYDGVIYTNDRGTHEFVALTSNQFKSADPVTYDNDGKVIPLSERFKENKVDIRYSTKKDMPLEAVFGFYSDVVRENKAWSLLNNMLEIQTNSARKGIHLRRKDIETVAKKLIKDNSSTMTVEELYMRANSVRPYIKHCFIVLFRNAQDSVPCIT